MTRNAICFYCDQTMVLLGERELTQTPNEKFAIYVCPNCGKAEFFLEPSPIVVPPQMPPIPLDDPIAITIIERPKIFLQPSPALQPIPIPLADPAQPPLVTWEKLLKIEPGKTRLGDLFEKIGHPVEIRDMARGLALRYPSTHEQLPHLLIVDQPSQQIIMVAIYNENAQLAFAELEAAYGPPEEVGLFNGCEHWLFSSQNFAVVVEGRSKDDILYFQILPAVLTYADYLEVNGFSEETFAFSEW